VYLLSYAESRPKKMASVKWRLFGDRNQWEGKDEGGMNIIEVLYM
jgi:hypothetical protein